MWASIYVHSGEFFGLILVKKYEKIPHCGISCVIESVSKQERIWVQNIYYYPA